VRLGSLCTGWTVTRGVRERPRVAVGALVSTGAGSDVSVAVSVGSVRVELGALVGLGLGRTASSTGVFEANAGAAGLGVPAIVSALVAVAAGGVQPTVFLPGWLPEISGTASPTTAERISVTATSTRLVDRSPACIGCYCYFGIAARAAWAGRPAMPNAANSVPGLVTPKFKFHKNIGPTQPQALAIW
jgi:hypothetical protein